MIKRILVILLCLCFAYPISASELPDKDPKPIKKRNYFFNPLGSFFVPGLDQFITKQPLTGAAFLSLGVSGLGLYALGVSENSRSGGPTKNDNLDSRDKNLRLAMLGYEMYMTAGGLSMYHSFRDTVETRPDDFPFLKARDSDWDLVLSPVKMDYLTRPTTFIPLLIQAGLVGLLVKEGGYHWQGLTLADGAFATAFSFGAGTWEECAFRGWMMPVFRKWVQNDFWSNAMTATVFAAAHYSNHNQLPIFQLLSGWYLGYVTQRNDWSVSESIFIHSWIDVIAFTAAFAFGKEKEAKIQLTPIMITF